MATNPFDQFDTQPSAANPFDQFDAPEPPPSSALRRLGDLGIAAVQGAIAVPEAVVGLADLVTGGKAGKLAERVGFRPKEAKDILSDLSSPELKAAKQKFQQADGVLDKTGVALTNPSLVADAVVQSLPATLGGGVAARGLLAAAPKLGGIGAAAAGEGLVGAGSAAEGIRQETADGELTAKQSLLAAGSGLATGAFGALGGAAARKLGIGDVDTALATGTLQTGAAATTKALPRRAAEGFVSEGFLEELPQSLSEQALQNIALDKPVTEGLADAGVLGVLSGGAMGAGAAAISGRAQPPVAPPPAPAPVVDPNAGPISRAASLALPAPVITVDPQGGAFTADQRQAARDGAEDVPFRDVTPVPQSPVSNAATLLEPNGAPAQLEPERAAINPVAQEPFQPSAMSLEEADAADQAAYNDFFNAVGSPEFVAEATTADLLDDGIDWDSPGNADTRTFLASLGATEQEIEDAITQESSRTQTGNPGAAGGQANDAGAPGPVAGPTQGQAGVGAGNVGSAPAAGPVAGPADAGRTDNAGGSVGAGERNGPVGTAVAAGNAAPSGGNSAVPPAAPGGTPAVVATPIKVGERITTTIDGRQVGGVVEKKPFGKFRVMLDGETAARVLPADAVARAEIQPNVNGTSADAAPDAINAVAPEKATAQEKKAVAPTAPDDVVMPAAPVNEFAGKWFSSTEKAAAFLERKQAGDRYRVAQVGPTRFEVKPKEQSNGPQTDQTITPTPQREAPGEASGRVIDGFKAGDTVDVNNTTIKGWTVKEVFMAPSPILGEDAWAGMATVVSKAGKEVRVPSESLRRVASAPAPDKPSSDAPKDAAPEPAKQTKAKRAENAIDAQRADYFTPGNIVKSYSGHDRVLQYQPNAERGGWEVQVQAVVKQGDAWVPDSKDSRERWHTTEPDAKALKAGPVARLAVAASPKPEKNGSNQPPEQTNAEPKAIENVAPKSQPVTGASSGAVPKSIEDFGEKLVGARKDYATLLKDAESVDVSAESLSKSWPEPDYQKLLAAGVDPFVVGWVRASRDEVPTKPQKAWKLNAWVESVKRLRSLSGKLLDGSISKDMLSSRLAEVEFRSVRDSVGGRAELYQAVGHEKSLKGLNLTTHRYTFYKGQELPSPGKVYWHVEQKARTTAFSNWPSEIVSAETRELVIAAFQEKYATLALGGAAKSKASFVIYRKNGQPGAFIGKKIGREYVDLHKAVDVKAARAYLESDSDALEKVLARYKDTPYERSEDNAPRVGADHRGGALVTPQVFSDTFGFRGVQFGNYVEQGRRQSDLNEAYDALMDMAAVLDLPPRALSLGGRLGLAFGARGRGGKNAPAAHYEPGQVVINLTKGGGPGSLAHEWFHSMDNYFAKEGGTGGYMTDKASGDTLRAEMRQGFTAIKRAIQATGLRARSQELDKRRSAPYWATPLEMSARTFESYVIAKLQDQGASNDYLANVVSEASFEAADSLRLGADAETGKPATYPYPTAQEMATLRGAYDDFFKTIQTKEDDGGNTVMFSRRAALSGSKGQRAAKTQETVDRITATWKNGPKVVVVRDMQDTDVPESVRRYVQQQEDNGADGVPKGFFYGGKVYLVGSTMEDAKDVTWVLFHEALGHYGLQNAFGGSLKPILKQVANMRRAEVEAKAKDYGLNVNIEADLLRAAEEVLAEMAQTRPELGFVRRAIAAIRAWLRTNVAKYSDLRVSDDEIIRNFILPARAFVEQGVKPVDQTKQGGALTPAFARSAMNSVEANIKRGTAAMNKAILEKVDANRAMFRPGIGWVDFVWGDAKKGLQHIIAQRQAKDGMTEQQAIQMLTGDVVKTIAQGEAIREKQVGLVKRMVVSFEGAEAVLVQRAGGNGWLLSGWKTGGAGAGAERNGSNTPTLTGPTPTRTNQGATTLTPGAEATRRDTSESGSPAGAGSDEILSPPMFARATGAKDVDALKAKATDALNDLFNAPGKLNWWQKTVGTMYDLAERNPAFKRVFDAGQAFINDISASATEAANLAPRILPKLETWRDIAKSPLSAADTKAIAAPIFEGTLLWARDEAGDLVRFDELQARYANMDDEQKAQVLLRLGKVTEGELKRWQATPLPIYEGAVRNRFDRELGQPGVVFTDAELRGQFKLDDNQISLYREFRAATDKSLNNLAVSDMLRYGGKDVEGVRADVRGMDAEAAGLALRDHLIALASEQPDRADLLLDTANKMIDKADRVAELVGRGYAPLSRFGQYTLDVVDENGERVYFGLFESRMEAGAMARKMKVNFPGAQITQGTMSDQSFKLFAGVSPETLELFGEMLGLEGTGTDAQSQAFQQYLKLAKSNRSALKRLIERKGIAGFSEDAGRVLAGFIYSNARQSASNLHLGEMTEAANAIPQQQGELKDVAIKLADYIKNPQEEAQAVRGLLFAQYLGGSIASALVNLTQPIAVTTPYLSQFGGAAKAARRMAAAVKDSLKATTGDKALDDALVKAAADGIVAPQEVHQLLGQAQGRGSLKSGDGTRSGDAAAKASNGLSKLSLAWGKLFGAAEQFNRRTTFIAAYRTAVEEGIDDPAAFAERAIAQTQFVYNKGNKPQWARGAIGSTLFTFKQYSVSYMELLTRMATAGEPGSPERQAGRRAALLAVGMLFLLSGAGGLPFAEDAEDVIDGVLQRLGYNFSTKQAKKEFLTNVFGQGGAHFVENGISGLPGVPIDVSGRLGLGNLLPGTGLFTKKTDYTRDLAELAGPAGDLFKRGFQAANQLAAGEIGKAVTTISPVAGQNLAKAVDMATTGIYRDAKGKKVLDVDGFDVAAKAIGFQPSDVARVQEATGLKQNLIAQNKMRESEIADLWALGVFEKDQAKVVRAREALADWNEKNPSAQIRIQLPQIAKRVRALSEDKATRIAKTAPAEIRASVRRELAEDLAR